MAEDLHHSSFCSIPNELEHHYGKNVHILSSPLMLTILAKLGATESKQPEINVLIKMLYEHIFDHVIDLLFPKIDACINTRMKSLHKEGIYKGKIIDPSISCITVDLARAGTYPSHLCYEKLNYILNPDLVRQDHFYIARVTDKNEQVTGVNVSGSKIGGAADKAIVLFPDPMGATGATIVEVYNHYKKKVPGTPLMLIAMHLIVTPEYLKKVTTLCPDLHIFSLRLDRGLSPENILSETPGKFWSEEVGLNHHQYIVPGAGGLGEVLNNSYC